MSTHQPTFVSPPRSLGGFPWHRVRVAVVTAVVAAGALGACRSGAPAAPASVPAPAAPPPSTAVSGSAAPVEPLASAAPSASAPAVSDEVAEDPACPEGMILVEGDYCTEVEQTCIREWYAEANKKRVCEAFLEPSVCTGEKVPKRFCIDRYSWPNVEGERPEVMNNFYQAQVKCASVGKRMCTESEWTFACEGPEMKPFPYGYERDPRKCLGDLPWDSPNMDKVRERDAGELARLWHGVRSGGQPECVSDFGVHDLPGNNDEVVSSETFDSGWRGKYDSVTTGGPWYKGVRNQCRPKIYTHEEGFYYYYLGFRCCAEPDGEATDPRTPKQLAKDRPFEWVERLAGVTVAEVQELLARKAVDGHCGCSELAGSRSRWRCHTICGTLLGPGAVDTVLPAAEGPPPSDPSAYDPRTRSR